MQPDFTPLRNIYPGAGDLRAAVASTAEIKPIHMSLRG